MRAFADNDVVMLENVRCNGVSHGGCKRGCTVFWREDWVRSTTADAPAGEVGDHALLARRLKTKSDADPELYYCQSSQLLSATHPLSGKERLRRCIGNVMSGNYGVAEMIRNVLVWFWVRGREKLFGPFPAGKLIKTPVEVLDLQVGERVEVKSITEIKATLDARGWNRGLHFAPEMIPYCGRQLCVVARADRMIMEGTGIMRTMKHTVVLENSYCDSATWAFGACPRLDLIYWREIWLKRVHEPATKAAELESVQA